MSQVSPGPEPTEFRYTGRSREEGAVWVLFMFSALLTAGWGVAALLQASWLDSGGLPGESTRTWGIVLLCVAAVEGLCGVLVLFSRRIGLLLGVGLALLGIAGHLAVIGAYPIWSIVGIVVYVVIIGILASNRPGR